jgi:MFS family permease
VPDSAARAADDAQAASAAVPGSVPPSSAVWSPWRAVVGFGVVSLAADMVYEGARSITGPLLASLGASALLVGIVTGAGEALALVLRLVFGPRVDRSGNYWSMTLGGYALTAVCVPALALTPFLGAAGLAVASVLILAERTGKAVRSPAKSTLLAHAAGPVGLGRGFGVHKALDQVGSFAGPLLVAGIVAATGAIWPAMAALVLPGAAAIAVLLLVRLRVGDPLGDEVRASTRTRESLLSTGRDLPREFWLFATAAGLTTAGLVTFGVISYHLVHEHVVTVAAVPVVYAAAMAAAAVAALVTGWLHDRSKGRVLLGLPVMVAVVPALAFSGTWLVALAGVLVWGAAGGVQDSTVKALVAQLVPTGRRATGYGLFAAVQGGAAVAGGALAGWLSDTSIPALVATVAVLQALALGLLVHTLRNRPA